MTATAHEVREVPYILKLTLMDSPLGFHSQEMKYPKLQEAIWTGQGKPPKGALTTGREEVAYSPSVKPQTPSGISHGQAQTKIENCIPVSTQGAELGSKTAPDNNAGHQKDDNS